MAYRLTRKAAADVHRIFVDGALQFGLAQAEAYHERLHWAFGLIADNPEMGRVRPELSADLRVHPIGSHAILYTVDKRGGVLIVRVRHGREDWLHLP